jgi:hypothetical protein
MSIMDIMAAERNKYGRIRKTTKTDLAKKMTTRLATTEEFDTHVSNLQELFIISKTGGHPVKDSDQVDILRASVLGHSLIDQALKQYDFENSDESTHTFSDLATYISDHLPNLQSAAKASTQATTNNMASEAFITLQAENKALKEKQSKGGETKKQKRKDGKGG